MKPEFLDLEPGDTVRCIEKVIFCGHPPHEVGDIIEITEETQYYYKHPINHKNYEIVKKAGEQ